MTKKILIVGSNSIHFTRYLSNFTPDKFDVEIITNKLITDIELPQHVVNFSLVSIVSIYRIKQIINQVKPDIIHVQQINSYAWFSLLGLRLSRIPAKIILTAWGSDILILPQQNILFKKLIQFSLAQANVVTSDSLYMSSQIKKLCNVANVITLNFGVKDLPVFDNKIHKQKIILSNRLHKKLYNIDKIICGFAKFIYNYPQYNDYKLVVAASGDETPNLYKLVQDLDIVDKIEFVGMLDQITLRKYYQIAQVFVSIPDSDATSVSLLEALSYGCIPVLSNLPANLEWVIDEYNGLINQNNANLAEDIAAGVILANSDHYIDFYKINHALVATKADYTENIQKFFALYE